MATATPLVLKVGNVVMVYGIRGVVRYVGSKEYITRATGSVQCQLIGVELDKRISQCTNGSHKGVQYVNGNTDNIIFVQPSSIRQYSETEAAATIIQSAVRTFLCKVKFIKEISFLFWDHMENMCESRTLSTKNDVSLPVINHMRKMSLDETEIPEDSLPKKRRFSDQIFDFEIKEYKCEEDGYTGPKLGKVVTEKFAHELLDAYKLGTCIQLPIHYAQKILLDMLKWYQNNDKGAVNYVSIPPHDNSNLILVGDLHGQLNDLLWLFYKFGPPSSRNIYLFNGDIADRGTYATNIFLLLFAFKLVDPNSVIINRGNHESDDMNESYGFAREVKMKYDGHIYNLFQRIFWELPLSIIIEDRIIVVHGGLFRHDGVTIEQINKVDRKRCCPAYPNTFEDSIMFDLLWSDPQNNPGRDSNTRGSGCIRFGPDVTAEFLKLNNLEICIRSHQVPYTLKGIDISHGGKCVTLFSASNYCQTTHNTGAIMIFRRNLKFEVHGYMAPSLDSIHQLANTTNVVTNKVVEAVVLHEVELKQKAASISVVSDKLMDDILLKICELICDHKQELWLHCYKNDVNKKGTVTAQVWREGLAQLTGTVIPWKFSIDLLKAIDSSTGLVHYNDILKNVYVGFVPVDSGHQNLKKEWIAHLFDTMIKSDLSLKEILMVFDRNLDGLISYPELDEAIRKLNIGLSNPQVKILMRTIFASCLDGDNTGKADIVEFLSKLKVIYSASIEYHAEEEWMKMVLPAIGRQILSNRIEAAARYQNPDAKDLEQGKLEVNRRRSSAIRAFALFQKFREYDETGDGFLSYVDFVSALKLMDLSKVEEELGFNLTDHHLNEIARMIDVSHSNRINYLEFLQAFYVVDERKYSVVNEMWDHICCTLYRHKVSLTQALYHYDVNRDGTVYVREFKDVLYALHEILGVTEAPLTPEQIEILVECMDTNDEGMIVYHEFLDSFKPMYSYKK